MSNPWDIPPWPAEGDKNSDQLFASVGKTLTLWELVEEELANLFSVFVGNDTTYPATDPAIRAYGTIISAISRTEMIGAAGKAFFLPDPTNPLADEAGEIIKLAKGWAGRRNDVAHGRVGTLQSRGGYLLFPSLYNSKKHPLGDKPTFVYSSAELATFQVAFDELRKRINFYRRILGRTRIASLRIPPEQ